MILNFNRTHELLFLGPNIRSSLRRLILFYNAIDAFRDFKILGQPKEKPGDEPPPLVTVFITAFPFLEK